MNTAIITFNDLSTKEFPVGTKLIDIAKDYQSKLANPIIGAKINNEVVDFNTVVKKDTTISFFDCNDINGRKMYQAGLKFVMIAALKEIYGDTAHVIFEHSIDKGIMCTISNGKPFDEEMNQELKNKMQEIINQDIVIEKQNILKKEAIPFYTNMKESEKTINIQNISNSIVVLYKLKNCYNYFYVDMPYSTGVLNKFNIIYLSPGKSVLIFPASRSGGEIPEYIHNEKVVEVFDRDKKWLEKMGLEYVSSFNKIVTNGSIAEFIRMNELMFEQRINEIVREILSNNKLRMILLAGPSSSGKTTTTKKLAMFLRANGKKVLQVSVDDYFKDREETPRLPNGDYDFESLNALCIDLFNEHLLKLINGEPIHMPTYDFKAGKKVFDEKETIIDKETILLIEGLHCLNEELTKQIARDAKYKIYLSPFTPLSIDRHNHVSTVDIRLIRRIIRDNRTRGWDVTQTIKTWQNVRNGEENYIFPYIKEADAVLNTALVYELGVLKVYAEPLLYSVSVDSPYYEEARRLISFLKSFFTIPSEYVVDNSILREFIGGSVYERKD